MKNKLQNLRVLVLVVFIGFLTASAWTSSRDIEKRAFVLMQGIDAAPDNAYDVTYSIAAPHALGGGGGGGEGGGSGGGKESMLLQKTRCKTLWQGHHFIQAKVEYPLFWGQIQTLVLGEDLARRGVTGVMDVFMRTAETRLKSWVVVADGKADKIVETAPQTEKIPSLYICRSLEMKDYLKMIPLLRVAEFTTRLENPGEQAIAPMVKKDKDNVVISGLALFKEDKMVGKLDYEEMHYYFLAAQKHGYMYKRVETPKGEGFVYEISNVKRRVRPHLNNDQVSFTVALLIEGNIVEVEGDYNLQNPESLRQAEQAISTALEKDCRAVLRRLQKEFKVDTYGFGTMVRGLYPKVWKQMDWNEEFPNVPIKITVDARIRRLGMVTRKS